MSILSSVLDQSDHRNRLKWKASACCHFREERYLLCIMCTELSGHKVRLIHLHRVISYFPQFRDKLLENRFFLSL